MQFKTLLLFINCLFLASGLSAQNYQQPDILSCPNDTVQKADNMLTDEDRFVNRQIARMDSLLNLWYVKSELAKRNFILPSLKDKETAYDYDSTGCLNNDSILEQRLSKIVTAVPLAFNARVKRFIELYAMQRKFSCSVMLGLAQYYYPWMKEIFDRYELPEELVYLTIIESGLNPTAVSHTGATGIWQFMYNTGKLYGLHINTFVDERRDPYKATDAAARYLRDLYNIFDDWGLAISAYNCGVGNVRKAIQRSGGKTNFWDLCRYLPKETQNYFPAFIGAYYMVTYHHLYGIEPANLSIPILVDSVMVNKEIHFAQIAHVLNIEMEEIKALNPQYKRLIIPAYHESYPLCLRSNDIIRFIALEDSIHKYHYEDYFNPAKIQYVPSQIAQSSSDKYHYVKRGESLSQIASRYGTTVNQLKSLNKLHSNTIVVNQRLLVRRGVKVAAPEKPTSILTKDTCNLTSTVVDDSTQTTSNIPEIQTSEQKPFVTYIVKKGDTLSAIAQRYGSKTDIIALYNRLQNKNALKIGQKIIIPYSE